MEDDGGGLLAPGPSHTQTKARALELYEDYRTSEEHAPPSLPRWSRMTEDVFCKCRLHESFVDWLANTHVIAEGQRNAGSKYAGGTVLDYYGAFLNQGYDKFNATGSAETKLWFTCLDSKSNSETACWLRKMKRKIYSSWIARMVEIGEEIDKSVPPVYAEHLTEVSKALAMLGLPEALARKLAIRTLRAAAGRACESGHLHWDAIEWDVFVHEREPQRRDGGSLAGWVAAEDGRGVWGRRSGT
jgi:hypothetical protein